MPDAHKVLIVAREMWEGLHDGREWKTATIEEQRRWCNFARAALKKARYE